MRLNHRGATLEAKGGFPMATDTAKVKPVKLLLREHERLLDHVEHVRVAALELPALSPEERRGVLDRIIDFLRYDLGAHAESEERALYPHVARLLGDPRATETMAYDHSAIRQLTARLAEASIHDVPLLQELLYGLHALITLHFRKEEELYVPLLEGESSDAIRHLAGTMGEIRFEHRQPASRDL
jgi:hemerythrin-like domain-containing protein